MYTSVDPPPPPGGGGPRTVLLNSLRLYALGQLLNANPNNKVRNTTYCSTEREEGGMIGFSLLTPIHVPPFISFRAADQIN